MNKCPPVGGQAVLEGVMMRSPKCLAVAVRRSNGEIVVREEQWRSIWERLKFLRWPGLRGTVVMAESLLNGISALNFSAEIAMRDSGDEKPEDNRATLALGMVLGLVAAIGLFKFLPHLAAAYAGELIVGRMLTADDLLYHIIDGVVKVGVFIGYVAAIGQMEDIKRVFMYHGAEHKAIYTLEAEEELTVENARKKSRLHPRCGTAFLMVVILFFIVVSAVLLPWLPAWAKPGEGSPWYTHVVLVMMKLPLLIPVAGLAYEFNRFAGRHVDSKWLRPLLLPGLGMQLLTTKEPTDEQLEIGLVALRASLRLEATESEPLSAQNEPGIYESFAAYEAAFTGKTAH